MAKITETTLRIRAQNLASKDLREVSTALDQLTENQKENSTAAGLAQRAMGDLRAELAALKTIATNLAKRGVIAEALKKDKIAIGETETKLAGLKKKLEGLNATKASGVKVKGIGAEIRAVEKAIGSAERKLVKQTEGFQKSADKAEKLGISAKKTGQSINKINVEVARTEALVRETEQAMEGYGAAVRKTRDALKAEKAIHRDINRQIERRREIEKQGDQIAAQRSRQQAADRLAQRRTNEATFAQFSAPPVLARGQTFGPAGNPAAVKAAAQASKEAAAATVRETALHERLNRVLLRRGGPLAKLATAQRTVTAAVNKSTAALNKNAQSLDRNHKLTGLFADTGRKSLSVYQRIRGQILATAAAYIGLFQAVNLVKSAVTKQQEFRRIDLQLETANKGDLAAAARDRKFLEEESDRLGLVYVDIAKNFANYKIAAESVGASNRTIQKSFSEATEIVTGLALSTESAERVFNAFTQILGKGKVLSEELRQQLGDSLPGAAAKFATSVGIQLSELDKYLKGNENRIEAFFKFVEDYAKTTKEASEKQSKTLFAQLNRLTNAYNKFLVTFAEKGVSSGLEKVVDELIAKLKGGAGTKFAEDLASAFESVARILLLVIQNFDTFVKLVKYYLSFQLAKAIVSVFYTMGIFGARVLTTAKNIVAFTAATNAARLGTIAMTGSMRALLFLLGPFGIAIGIVTAAWFANERSQRSATAAVEDHRAAINKLKTAQGEQLRSEINYQAQRGRALNREAKDVARRLAEAKTIRGGNNPIHQAVQEAADTLLPLNEQKSIKSLEKRLGQLQFQVRDLSFETVSASNRYVKTLEEETAARKKEAAEQDNFQPPKGDDEKEKKEKKGPSEKSLRAEANSKLDAARAINKQLLDLDQELFDAQIDGQIKTSAQIQKNYELTIRKIESEIEEKGLALDKLEQTSRAANNGNLPAEEAKSLAVAREKLELLNLQLNTRAMETAALQDIELIERRISAEIEARDAKIAGINTLRELGFYDEVEARAKIGEIQLTYESRIKTAVSELVTLLEAKRAIETDPTVLASLDAQIARYQQMSVEAGKLPTSLDLAKKKLAGDFATGVASALGTLAKGLAGGIEGVNGIGDAFKNAGNAFLEFLADFLVGIGQAILQAILLKAIMNAINGTSGGYTQAAIGALTGHTGGVVRGSGIGSGNPVRQVSPMVFANAQRFHEGGLPGLKRNEVPAILKKNEEVLTQDDPRNVLNGGGGAQPNIDLAIHNNIDSASVVVAGVNSRPGRKAIFNVIQANKADFKRMLA